MDLVSVIIPVYNVEDYLDRCIASVIGQTYENIEIILVDDGSTDNCPKICDDWAEKDDRVTVIHQRNCGLSGARNTGLKIASGDYIMHLDSDDYIAPFAVDRLIFAIQKTEADMVICGFIKGEVPNYSFVDNTKEKIEIIDSESALRRIYLDSTNALKYCSPWSKLYRHGLFDGILYPEGKIFEDIYTTHKLIFRCKRIAVLDAPLFYYFQRSNSIMNASFNLKKLDYLQALVERVEFFADHGLKELESIAYDELLHSLIWEYSRTRDILHSKEGMEYTRELFRKVYKTGYSSGRYPKENKHFLAVFNRNPEWIVWYWRINGKFNQFFKRNG